MRRIPAQSRRRICAAVAIILFRASASSAPAFDDLLPAPDFSQSKISTAADAVVSAWNKWRRADSSLEDRVLRAPTMEARTVAQQSLTAYLEFLDKRRIYCEAVLAYIEQNRVAPRPRDPVVNLGDVYQDQIQLLGLNLDVLQHKIEALHDSSRWLAVRRVVRTEMTDAMSLQSSRRADVPMDLSLKNPLAVTAMAFNAYRDSENQVTEILRHLWTMYYQALTDTGEGTSTHAPPASAGASPAHTGPATPYVGVWSYLEGSQQFNGIAEPQHVMLELRVENGVLTGRYRADLPGFQGMLKVDLQLTGVPSAKSPQALKFESQDPAAAGRIILEGPESGRELMLIRDVGAQSPIPRGRERLERR